MKIPFNKPYMTGKELEYIEQAHAFGWLAGDGEFTGKCSNWLAERTGADCVLLTHSCTAALEMAAILIGVKPGDEVIMPSFTFVSTANAFVLRGAVPVFVDIRPDTLNIDETLVEAAITENTVAIVAVHYAGVSCDMDSIMAIASKHDLFVIEDAAQGVLSEYKGKALGSIGHLGTFSFHETKNIISGEGGALVINDPEMVERAEIVREKGTNRSRFFRGQVDKYTWVDIGSSYLPSELVSAFLWAQLEEAESITRRRLNIWKVYLDLIGQFAGETGITLPSVPSECVHNAHMFYMLMPSFEQRERTLSQLRENEIRAVFHYVPLHSSPAGLQYGRSSGSLDETDRVSARLIRLPLWLGIEPKQSDIVKCVYQSVVSGAA